MNRPAQILRRFVTSRLQLCLVGLLSLLLPRVGHGQATSAPPTPQDPLMQLMLSQPKIDVESRVVPVAFFDPPAVRPGEKAILRIYMNALEQSIEWPDKLPTVRGLEVHAGAHGQILSMATGSLQPHTTFNYHVSASRTGDYATVEFPIRVYGKTVTVPSARLEVTESADLAQAQQVVLDLPITNLYVGESVRARVLFPGTRGVVQAMGQVQINGPGLIADQTAVRQQVLTLSFGPGYSNVPTFVYETRLTPLAAGKLSAYAQGYAIGSRLFSGVVLGGTAATPGGPPPYTLIDSEPVQLEVRPLPQTGKLPGFTGAVGAFAQPTAQLSTNRVMVGEPVKLTVKVRGEANMARLAPPPPPRTREWQVLPATPDKTTPPQVVQALGIATFTYALVPLSDKSHTTPAIPFSFFDPERGCYADLTIPPVPVEILPGTAPVDLEPFERVDSLRPEAEQELTLSELATAPGMRAGSLVPLQQQAWFPLLQCAPAAAFFGLWTWDRRRRFYEQHPNVLLCRRARRALKRERRKLQRVVRAKDAARFAGTAATAMRVASAPHYPAEPQALVGSDILALLPESQRAGRPGEVVRKLFMANDATRFALSAADCHEILGLAPEIEQILQDLEARL